MLQHIAYPFVVSEIIGKLDSEHFEQRKEANFSD